MTFRPFGFAVVRLATGLIYLLVGALSVFTMAADGRITTAKKGVGTWSTDGVQQGLARIRAKWYYNWQSTGTVGAPPEVEFVPMIWGPSGVTPAELARARASGRTLLGFNEPDRTDQANMTVQQALGWWPELMATGMRLGSPAPASDAATPGGWLDWFITTARTLGYRVDFIALHWYGTDFDATAVGQLQAYLEDVHERYGLPIWLTEYGLAKYDVLRPSPELAIYPTLQQQAAFVAASTRMLEELPYVERYAWFALPTLGDRVSSGLVRPDLTLTAVGKAYRAAG
jgi:hypothetical protein